MKSRTASYSCNGAEFLAAAPRATAAMSRCIVKYPPTSFTKKFHRAAAPIVLTLGRQPLGMRGGLGRGEVSPPPQSPARTGEPARRLRLDAVQFSSLSIAPPSLHAFCNGVLDDWLVHLRVELDQSAQIVEHAVRIVQVERAVAFGGVIEHFERSFCHFGQRGAGNAWKERTALINFPCSLTRNITPHSMKNLLAFESLLRRQMIVLPILTT